MSTKLLSSLVTSVLMMSIMWKSVVTTQFISQRSPRDGDSCHSFKYVRSTGQALHRLYLKLGRDSFPCRSGTVINSRGVCVHPRSIYADRCQDANGFSRATVNQICLRRPSAIFADPFNCASYFNCSAPSRNLKCPFDPQQRVQLAFDDILHNCIVPEEVQCGQRPMKYTRKVLQLACRRNPTRVWVDPSNCNSFFNCSQLNDGFRSLLPPYAAECPYLQLFDAETKNCRPYWQVSCGLRREIKNPCELKKNQCRTSHCRPCHVDNPDCTRKSDGNQPLDLDYYTPRFVTCLKGRTLGVSYCKSVPTSDGTVEARLFHPKTKQCEPVSAVPRSLGGLGPD